MKSFQRGFTLIELLVVIAIIALLSAIVIGSLNSARTRGTDASIKADLSTVAQQAVLDYDSYPNSYGITTYGTNVGGGFNGTAQPGTVGVTIFGPTTTGDASAAAALNQASIAGGGLYFGANGTAFFVVATLKGGGYWCIDATGVSKSESVVPTASTYSTFTCP